MTTVKPLVEHTLFAGFSPELLQQILDRSSFIEVEAGELVIEKGVSNSNLFVLFDGEINVVVEEDGANLVLPVWPGECIGEMSLMLDRQTSAYAVAQKTSRVLTIPEDVFWDVLVGHRQGVKNLMSIMTQRLRRNNQALFARMEEQLRFQNLQKELDAAGNIQSSMLPDIELVAARYPQVEAYGLLKQTSQVGGDFYDLQALDQDHLYFAIGDASGKGMMAALFTVRALTALRMTVLSRPFHELLQVVNTILMRNNPESMFITLFAGVLNVKTGRLQYLNAGHNPTLGTFGGDTFAPLPMPHGSVLGITSENKFTMEERFMHPDDILVMYTDGVTEAMREDGKAFNESRLVQTLNSCEATQLQQLVQSVDDGVQSFIAGAAQYDDLAILAVKYAGD